MTSLRKRPLAALVAATILATAPASAQSGFTPGELILYSPAIQNISSDGGAILRIDPVTGTTSMLLDLWTAQQSPASIAYDAYRDRLVFVGSFPTVSDPLDAYLLDGFGNTTSLGLQNLGLHCITPASGGRIYLRRSSATTPFQYLDASNNLHTLMDSSGSQPWTPTDPNVHRMIYDPGTNALFLAMQSHSLWGCSGQTPNVSVQRVELSVDGSRVTGVTGCVEVVVDPAGGNRPVGFSRAPGGQLLLVVDDNSNFQHPRMNLIDPVSLAVTPFASNGPYTGAAATSAGCYSTTRGQAVVLDTFSDTLRFYAQGEVGAGTPLATSMTISHGGSSGETATLLEIDPAGCGNTVGTYCTAKQTSTGCTPQITTTGAPSASASSGFVVQTDQVEPQNLGIFFYGQSGPAAVPFQGGFLCVQPPTLRTPPTSSGGAAACSGAYSIDFNAYRASGADPQLVAGSTVHGQFWFRDPPEPISGTGLSEGVTFTLCP